MFNARLYRYWGDLTEANALTSQAGAATPASRAPG